MIEINLLPEHMRKAEATPLPRFLALCAGVLMVCTLTVFNLQFMLKYVPDAEAEYQRAQETLTAKKAEAARLDEINQQIDQIKVHVGVVKDLYRKRRIWAKVLYDVKRIVTADKVQNESNPQLRYVWLNQIRHAPDRDGGGTLELVGCASHGTDSAVALQEVERLLGRMLTYRNTVAPEEEERKRIEETVEELTRDLNRLQQEWTKLRAENPNLPTTNNEIASLGKEIEGLKKDQERLAKAVSGRVALLPFASLFENNSVLLSEAAWANAPVANAANAAITDENLPKNVHNFTIKGTFKTVEEEGIGGPPGR